MFIQTESTPNPNTLKFLPGIAVAPSGNREYKTIESADSSPLAKALFGLKGIESVFLGSDFISVTKSETSDWSALKLDILSTIMDHAMAGKPIVLESEAEIHAVQADDKLSKEIIELIDTKVRPAVAQDGGDIVFRGFKDGTVFLELHGACSGCPSSSVTLKQGIERMLKHYIPEVEAVEAVS